MVFPQFTGPFLALSEIECYAIICALCLMAFDVISGVVQAFINHDFQSVKMREGLGHKVVLILVIALALVIQGFSTHIADLGFSIPLITPVCAYIIFMELTSILENLASAYPDLAGSKIMQLFKSDKEGT